MASAGVRMLSAVFRFIESSRYRSRKTAMRSAAESSAQLRNIDIAQKARQRWYSLKSMLLTAPAIEADISPPEITASSVSSCSCDSTNPRSASIRLSSMS